MALDIYDSQYLLILAPSLVIALMFLFFWLFMKETSYDEVLARQKRDLKLPSAKPDSRKKNEKKKSKRKEVSGGGSGGGGGGESEEDLRDFDMSDGLSPNVEAEEEPEPLVTLDPSPPAPSAEISASSEAPSGLRERKKKEKKAAKAAAAAAAAAALAAASHLEESEINDSKPVNNKREPSPLASKQVSPTSLQMEMQVQVQAVQAPIQTQTPPQTSGKKRDRKKQKVESADIQQLEVKAEQAPVPSKKDAPAVAEPKVLDGVNPSAATGKKKNSAKKQKTEHVEDTHILADITASTNHQETHNDDVPSKTSGKKQKNEADKGNAEVKLKELLSALSSLALSEVEAVSVISLLREKSPNALDAWHKSTARPDPAAQEREKLLVTLQEESSIAKDKVKQLSQELQHEKQKTGRVEAMMREQRAAMEKELGGMQAKAQGSYQELQNMQIKFQQMREQMESQITRLQQENGILRDAVSSATTQMESKNSAELNKLRSEYAGLMKELGDTNSKLQQEEHQRKSLEVNYKQNVSQLEAQLQDAKRRWEELQNFLHNVNTEREKLQSSNQELHSQFLAIETEMNNKNKEMQTLHSSLTEVMVSKEQLERRVMELMEMSQRSMPDETLQAQVQELMNEKKALQVQNETQKAQNESLQAQISSQATHVSHIEELQKLLAEKELQRKSLEDALNAERSSGAGRETNMQVLHNENISLKTEIQNLQAQIADQTASQLALDQIQKSVREKDDNIKTVEGLLEKGLIEVANKEAELKNVREENVALRKENEDLKKNKAEQVSSESKVEELQHKIQERDEKLKTLEESLQAAQVGSSTKDEMVKTLEQQLSAVRLELEELKRLQSQAQKEMATSGTELQDLQAQLAAKDQEIQVLQAELEGKTKDLSEKVEQIQQQQSSSAAPSPELLAALSEKENRVRSLQSELTELRDSLELHRKKNNELREKNWSAMEALSATESMLQGKLSKAVKEGHAALAETQAECRDFLHRLLPHVPLPSEQNHQEWLQRFESAAAESLVGQSSQASRVSEELAEKLKEAEESQRILQKDCETYKKVLAETEGILQRLQSSVEEEESRWKVKLEQSQEDVRELRREKQHLESELEKAERESATYVTEVRELKDLLTELRTRLDGSYTEAFRQNEELAVLKTQLTETLSKLEAEENERQRVAGDLYKAQQSLDLIQGELSKLTENTDDLIENSSLSSQREEIEKKEKMTAGLNQTVREMQQLLQTVSQQLAKGQQGETDKDQEKV
ncbi:kinectin isoform X1 [Cyprinodon tularosa]|uniref:kinectin isoform X1 n=1 Tax=Cyprinodon tularosa TaxID=77115 RepID=UPI0018E1EF0D|nr:kinectin isoform X1 [Cyprinodon tularosa]XP_038147276.1 kinectin isoform X1 [Cyprinodon tularosa]